MNDLNTWGYTSYKRIPLWTNDEGQHLYEARFVRYIDMRSYDLQVIRFWAHRPVIALRSICQSSRDPIDFHGKSIN